MIHYLNARMYEDPQRRAEEARFLDDFPAFAARHATALKAIAERTGLDYLGIDCAETREGELLVFEIDPAMVIHAMDLEEVFPNKQIHMLKVKNALRDLLLRRSATHTEGPDT
jgi:glutathione synthase/RimK-type ligase-like ATP-grasp enzyme